MSKTGKKRNVPVLLDVDGVIADFVGAVLKYCKEHHGKDFKYEDIVGDVRNHVDGLWDPHCEELCLQDGFALTIEPLPGAIGAVKKIMEKHDVIFLTSPYGGSKTWAHDRTEWLKYHFGISRDDIIFARDKRFVSGKALIDDKWENVLDWSNYQDLFYDSYLYYDSAPKPILFQQPWNRPFFQNLKTQPDYEVQFIKYTGPDKYSASMWVATDWDEVLKVLE